jgi:acetyl esterase/lipase
MNMETYRLWAGLEKPFDKQNDLLEYEAIQWESIRCVFNVTEPTLTLYPVENATLGVIVVPGGGYEFEAIGHEGEAVAEALSAAGISAAVLKYRLPNPASSDSPQLVPVTDARRALKVFRQKSGLSRVGLVGFSAGSHLSTLTSLSESADPDENPAFVGLIYGVTTFSADNRGWLEKCLYFRKMSDAEAAENNLLERVTPRTPPTFLVHACDDDTCPVEESTLYAQKLRQHGIPFEMHLFPRGGHGFGLGRAEDGTQQWLGLFINWLKRLG